MSFEMLDKLENKIQQTLETITLLQMELEEQKEKNQQLTTQIATAEEEKQRLRDDADRMKVQWQSRVEQLLGKMDEIGE